MSTSAIRKHLALLLLRRRVPSGGKTDQLRAKIARVLVLKQIAIDLDDGVKANYPKFYPTLKKITGLEAADG